jgi:Carboxypeptidase regulatory-like domain
MKKKRKPRKRIGTSGLLLAVLLPALLFTAFLSAPAAAKKKPALDTYAVISGSVFNAGGYALPDADVTLAPEAQSWSSSDKPTAKAKPTGTISDARGEFVFRVPPGPMHYTVIVAAKGYQSQRKSVSVEDQERVEVTFQLDPQSK